MFCPKNRFKELRKLYSKSFRKREREEHYYAKVTESAEKLVTDFEHDVEEINRKLSGYYKLLTIAYDVGDQKLAAFIEESIQDCQKYKDYLEESLGTARQLQNRLRVLITDVRG